VPASKAGLCQTGEALDDVARRRGRPEVI